MPTRLLQLCTLAVHHFSPGYAAPSVRQRLWDDASALPDHFEWAAFERKLGGQGISGIDLSVSMTRNTTRRFISALDSQHSEPITTPIVDALRRWTGSEPSPALQHICNVWLEFDSQPSRDTPLWDRGFCFFGPDGGPHREGTTKYIVPLVAELSGGASAVAKRAARLHAQLDDSATLLNVAYLPHRGEPEVRLHIGVGREETKAALTAVGWRGQPTALDEVLDIFAEGAVDRVALQFGIRQERMENVGFELYIPYDDDGFAWKRVLSRMVSLDLMTADEAEDVQAWHGTSVLSPGEITGFESRAKVSLARRTHIKFVLGKDGHVAAKAYLFVSPRYVPF